MAFFKRGDGDDDLEVTVRSRKVVEQHELELELGLEHEHELEHEVQRHENGTTCCFGKVVLVSMVSLILVAIWSLPQLWGRMAV
ncbi:unnamed protein product [Calypogeia fissa]